MAKSKDKAHAANNREQTKDKAAVDKTQSTQSQRAAKQETAQAADDGATTVQHESATEAAEAVGGAEASEASEAAGGAGADACADAIGAEPAALQEELKAERDRYLRLAAEYDNFRKRSAKERETRYGDARAETITRLLPVYDNLERALKMECSDEAFYKGIELTMTQLAETLENMGVTKIQAAGEPFDPNRHNAVMTVENPELGEKIVAEEYQKGFTLGERVIRFSTVVVAN